MPRSRQRHSCMRTRSGSPRGINSIRRQARQLNINNLGGSKADICKRITRRLRSGRRQRKTCKSSQIRNPSTGRCVKKTGKIGRSLRRRRRSPSVRRERKPCKSFQLRNPVTGRCVKKTGKIGRELLQQQAYDRLLSLERPFQPAVQRRMSPVIPQAPPPVQRRVSPVIPQASPVQRRVSPVVPQAPPVIDEEHSYNIPIPRTREHRPEFGGEAHEPEYRSLVRFDEISQQQPQLSAVRMRERFANDPRQMTPAKRRSFEKKYGTKLIKMLQRDGYTIAKFLGKGAFGEVYLLCKYYGERTGIVCEEVIKIQKYDPRRRVRMEEHMHKLFQQTGLAPEFHERFTFKGKNNKDYDVIRMGAISSILTSGLKAERSDQELEQIVDNLKDLVERLESHELTHGDMHYDNIALIYGDVDNQNDSLLKYGLIDFGWSSKGASPELEILKILQVTPLFKGDIHPKNAKYIVRAFKQYYLDKFGDTRENRAIIANQRSINKRYMDVHHENEVNQRIQFQSL